MGDRHLTFGHIGLVLGCFVLACSAEQNAMERDAQTAGAGGTAVGDTAGTGAAAGGEEPPCMPTTSSVQTTIFERSCDGVGCHGEQSPAASLKLVGTPPDQLLGVSASLCGGWSLLVPGSPEKSFLYHKLTARPPACGELMPLGQHLAPATAQCLADWISGLAAGGGCEMCGGSECVALASDPAHCGACDTRCAVGVACENGRCACPAGTDACGGSCVDVASDLRNCGACGTACAASQVCLNGVCAASCGSLTQCGAGCADLSNDPKNCGACGKTCGAGEACLTGSCTCRATGSVSFKNDVAPALAQACTSAGCHAGMRPKEDLSLELSKSYAELVNVTSSQCGGARKLVVPGAPSSSYLLQKLLDVDVCSGTQMPKAGQSLPQSQLDAISAWICSGAPNN